METRDCPHGRRHSLFQTWACRVCSYMPLRRRRCSSTRPMPELETGTAGRQPDRDNTSL